MIPQSLVLKNFLSHCHTVLNFEGLHTACICGENGAGKSSLLEAITWALWGKCRVEAEDDLIYSGATEVQVTFVFISQGNCYRIIRTRVRGHASNLEVQILSDGRFRSLTERGLRLTQQLLINHLKLDYDTFVHSAYLRQGMADAFMNRRPQERKQILAEVLQLEQYDRLAEKSKDIARTTKGELNIVVQQIERLQMQIDQSDRVEQDLVKIAAQQLKQKDVLYQLEQQKQQWEKEQQNRSGLMQKLEWLQKQSQQIVQDIESLTEQVKLQYQQCQQLESIIKQRYLIEQNYQKYLQVCEQLLLIDQKYNQYRILTDRRQQLSQALYRIETEIRLKICQYETQLDSLHKQQEQLQKIIDRKQEIQSVYQQYQKTKKQLQEYDRVHAQVVPLQQRLILLNRTIDQARGNLSAKKESLCQTYRQIQAELEKQQPLQKQLETIEEKIILLQKKQIYQQRVQEKGLERRDFLERLKVRMNDCEQQINQTQINIQQIEAPHANCPLCDQPLDQHHRQNIQQKHQTQLKELQAEVWLIKEQQSASEIEIKVLREEYLSLRNELQNYNQLLQDRGSLQSKLESIFQLTDRLTVIQQEIIEIDEKLIKQTFELDIQQEIKLLNASLERLGYNDKDHALLRNEVERLRWVEIKSAELKQAQQQSRQLSEHIPKIQEQIQELKIRIQCHQIDTNLQKEIDVCDREIQSLGYNYDLHQQLIKLKEENSKYQLQLQELKIAEQQLPHLQQQYNSTNQNLEQKKELLKQIQQEQYQHQQELNGYPDRYLELQSLSQQVKQHRQDLEQLTTELGKLQQLIEQIKSYRSQLQELKIKQQQLEQRHRVHQELALCFGKNGIQTLVIETVIPQIEAEANLVLGQLTNYQLNLRFITQKSGKRSDKFIDTLEIEISDHHGTRPYETYSGGEVFRINFAVRLALSRILAQRTGGSLQTLIIDEGFGSLDDVGCDRLVAAIDAVAQDFACILVITHIPKLKEAFSNVIEVTKTNNGSHVQLVL